MIREDLQNTERVSSKDYDSPSWAYLQAHKNGKIEHIQAMLTLLAPFDRNK